ncbi:LOW QUALITY PROTEIN: SCL-interrupting locus protein homolog [Haliotis rubra]|uniref:LOW QUALITY PROTEIN: SCL-interrupting locus protein homolog n=1 Tax=Haliotis rubra TaxID=36100 RepID=UPI001EE53B1D|nr:LOW QUALITY PROTEIN: SCL-interrupting locus protein homolog [Haliotis rubra]
MAVPIRLKSMPEHIRAQYGFPYPQVETRSQRQQCMDGSQELCEDLQMLQFPKTKVILWDHTVTGPPLYLHFAQYRKPRICLSEKVLRIAHRQCMSCGQARDCVLIGSLIVDDDGDGMMFSIDRLDNRPSSASTLKNLAPGDVMIPVLMSVNGSSRSGSSVEDYTNALKLLKHRCESREAVDVCNFLLTKGWCNFHSRGDQSIAHLDFDVVTLNTVIKASPIQPVPIIPTALSKNLAGPRSISHVQGTPKSGYLTMDHTRKLLLVLESDPKVLNLPVVGIWVSGVAMVHHPFVWASCIRYLHNKALQDRVCSPPEGFLVVLYSPLHSRPEFYECNTNTGNNKLNFDLYGGYEATNLNTGAVSLQNGLLECELTSVQQGKKREVFDAALTHTKQSMSEVCPQTQEQERGAGSEDIVPRSMPAPHQARMFSAQPMVPEVSLYFPDSPQQSMPSTVRLQVGKSQGQAQKKHSQVPQDLVRHMTFSPPVTPRLNSDEADLSTPRSHPDMSHSGMPPPHKHVAFTRHVEMSQPSSIPPSQGPGTVNGGDSVNMDDVMHGQYNQGPQIQNEHKQQNSVPSRCENYQGDQNRHFSKQGFVDPRMIQHVQNAINQNVQDVNINQNCYPYNQPRQLNGNAHQHSVITPHKSNSALTLPHVQLPSHKPQLPTAQQSSIPSFGPHLPHQSGPVPQGQRPQPTQLPSASLSAPTSASSVPTQYTQLNSAFTPNPHQGGHIAHHQPQVTGYPSQQNLLGYIPQLQTSYSSSRVHTESTCSGKSSDDSGLSVTPDRSNPSPKTGSPNTPDKTNSNLPSGLDTINWEQVPPEIYQLILAQNAQLQQLQTQMQQLLKQQSPAQTTPTPRTVQTESGIGVSPSTRETCETAVNTTLFFPSPGETTIRPDVQSVSLQTSPVKAKSPQSSSMVHHQQEPESQPSSSTQTPVEIRHKGALPLNSTQRDDNDQHDITQGDLTAVVDNINLHNQTVDSVQSELILDMPSYQSSPTSRSPKDSGSLDGSYQTSPISASMCGNSKESSSRGEEGESEVLDEAYYEHLLGNIRQLLGKHSDVTEFTNETTDLQMKLPESTQGDTTLPGLPVTPSIKASGSAGPARALLSNLQLRNGADTTFIPRINYLSMMLESDSDTSMEINAMALKYLNDEQLTQLGKMRKNSLNLPKQVSQTALLRRVLMSDTTMSPDVSQYGMSSNNITMGTQKYLEKYGLLNSTNGTALTDKTVTDETLQLKVDYSMAASPDRLRGYNVASLAGHSRDHSTDVRSPLCERTNRVDNYSGYSSSSNGSKSPIKKDFVAYSPSPRDPRRHYPTSPIKRHVSPQHTVHREEDSSPGLSNHCRRYEEPLNQHRYPNSDTSEFQVFNTTETTDNILDIDKLRQMPKLL